MVNHLLYVLSARLRCRLIYPDGRLYLERYYLGQLLGVTFYLHRFVGTDGDRHVHNHPWSHSLAVVLSGGYDETVATDISPRSHHASGCAVRKRRVRWLNWIPGHRFHKIDRTQPGTWTLFCHGARRRVGSHREYKGWGFLERVDAVTVVYRQYTGADSGVAWWLTAPVGRDAGRAPL